MRGHFFNWHCECGECTKTSHYLTKVLLSAVCEMLTEPEIETPEVRVAIYRQFSLLSLVLFRVTPVLWLKSAGSDMEVI